MCLFGGIQPDNVGSEAVRAPRDERKSLTACWRMDSRGQPRGRESSVGDLGHGHVSERRKGDQCETHVGDKARGFGGSLLEEESGWVPGFRFGGCYSERQGQWEKGMAV